jgi:hypothetical protein
MAHSGGITGNPYRRVHPAIWDDLDFVEANDFDRVLYFLLLTGPQVSALPGLQHEGFGALAERLRRPLDMVLAGFERLAVTGFAFYDERTRVVWVPNAPRYNEAGSPNHIRAWWNRWSEFPKCKFKIQHIPNLRRHAQLERSTHLEAWNATFGKVDSIVVEGAQALPKPSDRPSEGLRSAATGNQGENGVLSEEISPSGGLNARARAISGSGSVSDRGSWGGAGGDGEIVLLADWKPSDRAVKQAAELGFDAEAIHRSAAAMRAKCRTYKSGFQSTLDNMWVASWLSNQDKGNGGHREGRQERSADGSAGGQQEASRGATGSTGSPRRGPRGAGRIDEIAQRDADAEFAELAALGSDSKDVR